MKKKMRTQPVDSKDWSRSRTGKLVGLFAAALIAAGCTQPVVECEDDDRDGYCDDEVCVDEDRDGYCDDGSGRVGGAYLYKGGKKVYKKISGISSGSKGGVGSKSSGGWFSGG